MVSVVSDSKRCGSSVFLTKISKRLLYSKCDYFFFIAKYKLNSFFYSYEGRGGLCDIALSEPLLKLRPRKDLVETLLHEMIHAFLFVTSRDQDRDGHGPNFQSHMHRINNAAGLKISIYHDFHEEVVKHRSSA